MARKVIWADAAVDDLESAARYIANDSPAYAASFVNQCLKAGRSLAGFPERGRRIPELRDESIREIFIYSYRMIYRVEERRVSILALIHGRRDLVPAWTEKDRS